MKKKSNIETLTEVPELPYDINSSDDYFIN